MSENTQLPPIPPRFHVYRLPSSFGSITVGVGGQFNFRGIKLQEYLDGILKKINELHVELNDLWLKIDRADPKNPANVPIIERHLRIAAWSHALVMELTPFYPYCGVGPTTPLSDHYVRPLEQIFAKCCGAVYLFGLPEDKMVASRCFMNDFALNGGVDIKTGGPGSGIDLSINDYYGALFWGTDRSVASYECFAELIIALVQLVEKNYPKVASSLAAAIKALLKNPENGFGSTTIVSHEKSTMICVLLGIIEQLVDVAARVEKERVQDAHSVLAKVG